MKRWLLALAAVCALCVPAFSQSVAVAGSTVRDNNGNPLASGQWCFGATCLTVTAGSFSGTVTAGTQTVTITNGGATTYLTIPSTTVGGSFFNWDSYVVPSSAVITGIGAPRIACTPGAKYTQTDGIGSAWSCQNINGTGVWNGISSTSTLVDSVARAEATSAQTTANAAIPQSGGTFTGNVFGPSSSFKATNGVQHAETFTGATADVQIAACLAAAASICDSTGYGSSTQTIAALVTIPSGKTLLLDINTKFQPSSLTTPATAFKVEPDAHLIGLRWDCAAFPAYNGTVIANDQTQTYFANSGTFGGKTLVANVSSSSNCENDPNGSFIQLTAPNGIGIYAFDFAHVRANGFLNGFSLVTSGTGYINGLQVVDFKGVQSVHCIHLTTNAGTTDNPKSTIAGNTFSPYSCESSGIGAGGNVAQEGILLDGSTTHASISGNQFIGTPWDYTTAINQSISTSGGNLYIGQLAPGLVSDATSGNYVLITPFGTQSETYNIGSNAANQLTTDGTNIYLKSGGTIYLGTANGLTVDAAGDLGTPKLTLNGAAQATFSQSSVQPSTCTVGSLWTNPSPSDASHVLAVCYPANTWTYVTVP